MKREFLQNFKVGDTPLSKEIIDTIMAENGKDIEDAKKPFADYETVKAQLTEANRAIDGFKALDVDGVKKAADEWKTKYEQEQAAGAAKIADMEFNGRLAATITAAKGKNAKAIAALLDVESIKGSKNQEADLKAALEGLQKENAYLFDTDPALPPYATGTGIQNPGSDGFNFGFAGVRPHNTEK